MCENCWQHIILCASHKHDCPHGSQQHRHQTIKNEQTLETCTQLLDYLAHNTKEKVGFHMSYIIMNIHLNTSYRLEAKARSCACWHFFMVWLPTDGDPIKLNGAYHVIAIIQHFFVASAAEAKLGIIYYNCQTGIVFWQNFKAMGQLQPKIPVHCNNATAVGIANSTVKHPRLWSMEMQFFWIGDKVVHTMYTPSWHPGQENSTDY